MKYAHPRQRDATIGELIEGALLSGAKTLDELQQLYPLVHPKNMEGAVEDMVQSHKIFKVGD